MEWIKKTLSNFQSSQKPQRGSWFTPGSNVVVFVYVGPFLLAVKDEYQFGSDTHRAWRATQIQPCCSSLADTLAFSEGCYRSCSSASAFNSSSTWFEVVLVCLCLLACWWITSFEVWRIRSVLVLLCVNITYFYLYVSASPEAQLSLSICTQSARLSGSRTALRGGHVWLTQSYWRATWGLERATLPLLAAVEEMRIVFVWVGEREHVSEYFCSILAYVVKK